ncbi:MAG: hypothetical protein IKQ31_02195 [Clostridia bacterium]|nr:hypothetical protein [Clostridia bacterium]
MEEKRYTDPKSLFKWDENRDLWLDLYENVRNLLMERLREARGKNDLEKATKLRNVYEYMKADLIVPADILQSLTIKRATDLSGLEKCSNCTSIRLCTNADLSTIAPMPKVKRIEMVDSEAIMLLGDKFPNVEELRVVGGYTENSNGEMVPISLEGQINSMHIAIAADYVDAALKEALENKSRDSKLIKEFEAAIDKHFSSLRFDGNDTPQQIALLRSFLIKQRLANIYMEDFLKNLSPETVRRLKNLKRLRFSMIDYIEGLDLTQFDTFNYGVTMGENTIPVLPLVFTEFPMVEHSFELLDLVKYSDRDTKLTPLEFIKELNKCTDEEKKQLFEYIGENEFTDMGPEFVGVGSAQEMLKMYQDLLNVTDKCCAKTMDTETKIEAIYQWMIANIKYDEKLKDPSDLKGSFNSKRVNIDGAKDILNLLLATQDIDLSVVRMKHISPLGLDEGSGRGLNDKQKQDLSYHFAVGLQFSNDKKTRYFKPNISSMEYLLSDEQIQDLVISGIISADDLNNLNREGITQKYKAHLSKQKGGYINQEQIDAGKQEDKGMALA